MKANMNNYDSSKATSYTPVKPGVYLVKAVDAVVQYTASGNEMWKMTYEIIQDGNEFFGKKLFDNIVFAPEVMNRAKLIFEAFEVDMKEGDVEYQPDDILTHVAKVQVTHIGKYRTKNDEEREKSVIGFDGYFSASTANAGKQPKQTTGDDQDIPF